MSKMNIDDIRLLIGRTLLAGVIISFILIISGGFVYLQKHSATIIDYSYFRSEPKSLTLFSQTLKGALQFDALAIIQIGIFILIFVQILRVLLSGWYFIKIKDKPFIGFSMYILILMLLPFSFDG